MWNSHFSASMQMFKEKEKLGGRIQTQGGNHGLNTIVALTKYLVSIQAHPNLSVFTGSM